MIHPTHDLPLLLYGPFYSRSAKRLDSEASIYQFTQGHLPHDGALKRIRGTVRGTVSVRQVKTPVMGESGMSFVTTTYCTLCSGEG